MTDVDRRGDAVVLRCGDSDAALRAFCSRNPGAHDIEVRGAGLEEAFLELTADDEDDDEGTTSMSTTYLRFEMLRTFRNRRFLLFSLAFRSSCSSSIAGAEPTRRPSTASRSRSTT